MARFTLGQRVQWTSSNTRKTGIVAEIVAPGQRPESVKDAGLSRDHETYVVRGSVVGRKGATMYWPLVSLLHPMDSLTPDEIEWCHAHAEQIRGLMAAGRR